VFERAWIIQVMEAPASGDYPSLPELRTRLIPGDNESQWDWGELPRAVLDLESQNALRECRVLLRLACVARSSLDETPEARTIALREMLLKLLPKDLDDPCCEVLRVLAGLEPGTAGRNREQRQRVAGSRIGTERQPAHPRTVRRFARLHCWPWLLDRLLQREVEERKAAAAGEVRSAWTAQVQPPGLIPDAAAPPVELSGATGGRFPSIPVPPSRAKVPAAGAGDPPAAAASTTWMLFEASFEELGLPWMTSELSPTEWGRLGDDVKRRTFLLGVPAAWLFSRARPWQPVWSRVEGAMLDTGALDELAEAVAGDCRLHDRLGSRAVQGAVTEHVRLATDLLRGSPPPALRPRLAAIASQAAGEAAFVYRDQRQFQAAESYQRLAVELAHEAGDPLLGAYHLAVWSKALTDAGDGAQALPLLETAGTLASGGASPGTAAYLALCEAKAQGSLRNADACLRALDRFDVALDRGDRSEDPPWLYWLSSDGIADWGKGDCYTRAGRVAEAEATLTLALSRWDSSFVRDRAQALIALGFLRIRQGEPDECCHLAGEALGLAVTTTSPRLVQRIRDLRHDLEPWSESSGVKALDDQLVASASTWTL
jgi:tetratricopeptide (TPR) repeat protein